MGDPTKKTDVLKLNSCCLSSMKPDDGVINLLKPTGYVIN
jgi:hypothetical protein